MLTSLLIWVVLLVSLGTFLVKFLLPGLYQKNDVIWGSLGLVYGLMLALSASQMQGGLLLGQTAGVLMLVGFGWQTYRLRYTALPEAERQTRNPILATLRGWLSKPKIPVFKDKDQDLKDQTQAILDKLQNQPAATQTPSEPKAELSAPPATAADMTVEIPAVAVGIPTEITSAEKLIATLDPVELVPEPEPESIAEPESRIELETKPEPETEPENVNPKDVTPKPILPKDRSTEPDSEIPEETTLEDNWPPPGTGL
jgi:hypothetical protein